MGRIGGGGVRNRRVSTWLRCGTGPVRKRNGGNYLSSVVDGSEEGRGVRVAFQTFQEGVEIFESIGRVGTGHHQRAVDFRLFFCWFFFFFELVVWFLVCHYSLSFVCLYLCFFFLKIPKES